MFQSTQILKDIDAYDSSLTANPAYVTAARSVAAVLFTADIGINTDFHDIAAKSDFSWYTSLPTEVHAFFTSYQGAVQSIVDKDVKGAAPTAGPAVKAAGAVAAAGMAAVAML